MYESTEAIPDFKEIFEERLNSVPSVSGKDAENLASWYKDAGITELAKEIPVLLFEADPDAAIDEVTLNKGELWTDIPNSSDAIHDQLERSLRQFLGRDVPTPIPGYLLETPEGERYIVFDQNRSWMLQDLMSWPGHEDNKTLLLDVLNRYKISRVLNRLSRIEGSLTRKTPDVVRDDLIKPDLLDRRREDKAMIDLARKYGLTNSQYMRLKILADTLFKAGKQVSLDEVAVSIKKDDDDTSIVEKSSL